MERFKYIKIADLENLPKTTGVYAFFRKNILLYMGKAINIRDRVKSHFNQPSYRDDLFINQVNKIGFLETGSEIEALILEANLIKRYQPKYNVMWRDDKNYFYVAIAKNGQKIPYVLITHQKNLPAEYIGPFIEGTALKKTLRFLRKVFPYYTSGPRGYPHSKNKCAYCHLGLCPGPQPDLAEYKNNIKKLILILKGKRGAVLNSLKKEMKRLSEKNDFEEAGKIRDKIYNLQQVMAHAQVIESRDSRFETRKTRATLAKIIGAKSIKRIECYDVSNIQGKQATGSMIVFIDGKLDKSQYKKFKIKTKNTPDDIAMLKEVLQRRFAHPEWDFPEIILIDGGKAQLNMAIKSKIQMSNQLQNPKLKLIKIISIAKGRQDPLRPRSEARLFIEGKSKPIPLKSLPQEIYNLIKQLDDEAHRFAISYHKKLRKNALLR